MATDTKPKTSDEKSEPKKRATAPNEIVALSEDERRKVPVRERQFPSLYSESAQAVEVAERTIDNGDPVTGVAEPTLVHVKDFVALKRDLELEGEDVVHARNINAVRQYMVNQGIRPDADVTFEGSTDLGGPHGRESVSLRYAVRATPAVVATDFDVRHVTIPQEGPTATERAEYDAGREARIKAGYDAAREGTVEAERPNSSNEGAVIVNDPTASDVGGEPKK